MMAEYEPLEGLKDHIASLINESMGETIDADSLEAELDAYAEKIVSGLHIDVELVDSNAVVFSGFFHRRESK